MCLVERMWSERDESHMRRRYTGPVGQSHMRRRKPGPVVTPHTQQDGRIGCGATLMCGVDQESSGWRWMEWHGNRSAVPMERPPWNDQMAETNGTTAMERSDGSNGCRSLGAHRSVGPGWMRHMNQWSEAGQPDVAARHSRTQSGCRRIGLAGQWCHNIGRNTGGQGTAKTRQSDQDRR
jgi:hypothetical protein